ncbi:MAG: hypothetical protein KDC44_05050, partial [Phaeodactylibacter sp.]|nr:hypothetical protein [Phaeodactylibacter sp.]
GVPAPIGSLSIGLFLPDHGLAMSRVLSDQLPALELDLPTAIQFLRKENLDRPAGIDNGWTLASHQGHVLGWMKVIQNRINNYYPKNWRIRMEA